MNAVTTSRMYHHSSRRGQPLARVLDFLHDDALSFNLNDLNAAAGVDEIALGDDVVEILAEAGLAGGPQRRLGDADGAEQAGERVLVDAALATRAFRRRRQHQPVRVRNVR